MKLTQLLITSIFISSVYSFNSIANNVGSIDFVGSVINTPCNIKQSSLKQTVDFGKLSRNALEKGKIVEANFDIKFTGCDFNFLEKSSEGKSTETKLTSIKTMELVFTGQNYVDAKRTLLSTSLGNTNNLGIGIEGFVFGSSKNVLPNGYIQDDLTLTFKAIARAIDTTKKVSEGHFSAISNFRITYQ